jgi:hypothetical protein
MEAAARGTIELQRAETVEGLIVVQKQPSKMKPKC